MSILNHTMEPGGFQLTALDTDWIIPDSLGLWKTTNATVLHRLMGWSSSQQGSCLDKRGVALSVFWHKDL